LDIPVCLYAAKARVNFPSYSQDSIDVAELAAFTPPPHPQRPIPYKHGKNPAELENFLQHRDPILRAGHRVKTALGGGTTYYVGHYLKWGGSSLTMG